MNLGFFSIWPLQLEWVEGGPGGQRAEATSSGQPEDGDVGAGCKGRGCHRVAGALSAVHSILHRCVL